ncbi:MAG: hypothetical protein HGA45_44915, partial [Chloroflexales bacterium]|nr:hypothetical protein [Chloroflexales bacterium]
DELTSTQLSDADVEVGDELAPVQFGDDDALLDLGALGISWSPSLTEPAMESDASVLSLPGEDGPNGPILGVLEAVEAQAADAGLIGQDAKETHFEALREQPTVGRDAEAHASARRRATPGHYGRRRMPAVAYFTTASDVDSEGEQGAAEGDIQASPETSGAILDVLSGAPAPLAVPDLSLEVPLAEVELLAALVELAPVEFEPLAELEATPIEAAPAELEAPTEQEAAPVELEALAEQEFVAKPVVPATLADADAALAQGDLDAAEAGYRAVLASAELSDHRAARLGLGRVMAARRNPAPVIRVVEAPAPESAPLADVPTPGPVNQPQLAATQDDSWSEDVLFNAWSRGESMVSLSRRYAAANPALTLAGALARVREVVTRKPVTDSVKGFSGAATIPHMPAGSVTEPPPAGMCGEAVEDITMPSNVAGETRTAECSGVVSETPIVLQDYLAILDSGRVLMTNGSSAERLEHMPPMTNGSSDRALLDTAPMTNGSSDRALLDTAPM